MKPFGKTLTRPMTNHMQGTPQRAKRIIKSAGSFKVKNPNPFTTSLSHPFPNQNSYPDTNTMIMNPYSEQKSLAGNFVAHKPTIQDAPDLSQQTQMLKLEDPNIAYEEYIKSQAAHSINSLDQKWRKKNTRKLENVHNFLSVEEAINVVNLREYTLVSIDNEFYEQSKKNVIEVGVSIYRPQYQKFALIPHITNFHFIIKEAVHLRNGRFVPDSKMSNITGESYVISIKEIPQALDLIFEKLGPKSIIVGHSVKGDLDSFQYLHWKPPMLDVIDTSSLWLSLFESREVKYRLSYILEKLSVPNSFLHNGVNDAYYTLIVCLMLCSADLRNNLKLSMKSSMSEPASETEADSESDLESTDEYEMEPQTESSSEPSTESLTASSIIQKESETKSKRVSRKAKPVRFRCDASDEAIERKYGQGSSRKVLNPKSNYFFKPVSYAQNDLIRRLDELSL